jgi:hypothetical protein
MVIEATTGLEGLVARLADNLFLVIDLHTFLHLFLEVNTQAVNDAVAFCQGIERAAIEWADKRLTSATFSGCFERTCRSSVCFWRKPFLQVLHT